MENQMLKSLTRESIVTALLLLMREQPYEKITTTSIIERAGVSRAGFYKNYDSKNAVFDEILETLHSKMTSFFITELNADSMYDRFLKLFSTLREYKTDISLILKVKNRQDVLFDSDNFIDGFFPDHSNMNYYKHLALWHGIKAITYKWIENDMVEEPCEMAEMMNHLFHI